MSYDREIGCMTIGYCDTQDMHFFFIAIINLPQYEAVDRIYP